MRETLTPHQRHYLSLVHEAHGSSPLESVFAQQVKAFKLAGVEPQFKFHPKRKWPFDFAHPAARIAVEIQGGIHGKIVRCSKCGEAVKRKLVSGGTTYVREALGHGTADGLRRDAEKFNAAQLLGWTVLLVTPEMVNDGTGVLLFKSALESAQRLPKVA